MSEAAKFRYGRLYNAYFFEEPIVFPISVWVIAQSFEEALGLVREQFPGRTISAFFPEDRYKLLSDYSAVIVAPDLPETEPQKLKRDYDGVPEELSRGWFEKPKSGRTVRMNRRKRTICLVPKRPAGN